MSRVIPRDEALKDDDRRYLLERGQESIIALIDQQYPPDPEELAEFEAMMRGEIPPNYTGDRGVVLGLEARVAQLEDYIRQMGSEPPPVAGTEVVDTRPYSEWTKDELKAEADARGLSNNGNKPELVARLEAHDAAADGA